MLHVAFTEKKTVLSTAFFSLVIILVAMGRKLSNFPSFSSFFKFFLQAPWHTATTKGKITSSESDTTVAFVSDLRLTLKSSPMVSMEFLERRA